jgi:hypothetical protein
MRRWYTVGAFAIEKQLGSFLQYGRRGCAPHDPNDRGYDRKIEAQLKGLRPEQLDSLLRDEPPSPILLSIRIDFQPSAAGWLRADVRARRC